MKSDAAFHLGIDQGTQSSRAIIFDQDGSIITQAQIKVGIQILPNNFVEQDGNEILQSVEDCLSSLFKEIDPENICSAGLATQRSSVIAWDKTTGTAVSPLISWRDRRATEFIATLEKQENEIQKISGLRLTPYYGASKIRWLLRHHTQTQQLAEQQRLAIGPLASFLIYRLCRNQPYLIDHANALRLQLLNNDKLAWDDQLCQWFEIPAKLLPQTVATNYGFGELCQTNIRLNAVNGDQTAAMYSLGQMQAGECLVNLGTGGFVLCPVEQQTQIPHGLLGGLSMSQENQVHRLIEGTINGCGAALNWYKKFIHFEGEFDLDHCINVFQGKLIFQNGVNGLGSPLWQDVPNQFLDAGTLSQIDNPEQDQAVAAIVESILFLVRLNMDNMKTVVDLRSIRLSGGLSNSNALCQRLADLCRLQVVRPKITEATARGIAWLSGGAMKNWSAGINSVEFTPQINTSLEERYQSFVRIMQSSSQAGSLPE